MAAFRRSYFAVPGRSNRAKAKLIQWIGPLSAGFCRLQRGGGLPTHALTAEIFLALETGKARLAPCRKGARGYVRQGGRHADQQAASRISPARHVERLGDPRGLS